MDNRYSKWLDEAVRDARAKNNSALPGNRRARTRGNGESTTIVDRYVRGTLVELGHIQVCLL